MSLNLFRRGELPILASRKTTIHVINALWEMRVQVDSYNYAELLIIDLCSIIYAAGLTPDQRLSSEVTTSQSFSFHVRGLPFIFQE